MHLFSKKDPRISNRLELISVHIPKTAGTSFRGILKKVYGEQAVVRLDIGLVRQELRINEELYTKSRLSKKVRVAHGHFSPELIRQRFNLPDDIPYITWLRDPVERVISNYFYLRKRLAEELQEEQRGLNILKKLQRTLMEYARDEISQNRMSKFLAGIELEELFFVGIQDHFSEDLNYLAEKLNWPPVSELRHNITGRRNDQVTEEERAEIAKLNARDVELYQRALALREARLV